MATAAHVRKHEGTQFSIPSLRSSRHGRLLLGSVNQALDGGDRHVVIDCAEWMQLDLGMLSTVIQCASRCRERGADFELINLSDELRRAVYDLLLANRLGIRN